MALRPKRIAGAVRKDGRLVPIEEGEAVPPPKDSTD
jgi:hypothetical protein